MMLKRGNAIAQITNGTNNTALDEKKRNRRVSVKLFKTAYFMTRKKWAVKENFEYVVKLTTQEIGDDEIQKHLNENGKNVTYLSHFSVEKILTNLIEKELTLIIYLQTVVFLSLSYECIQLAVFARLINSTIHTAFEKFICVRKLGESKTAAIIIADLEEMFAEKYINKTLIPFFALMVQMQWMRSKMVCKEKCSTYALYIICCNHWLALCLVNLIKESPKLQTVDMLLLSIWKSF